MSKLDTKARSKRVKVDQNRMIPRFFQRPDRAAGSFVTDLDTIGAIGEIMNAVSAQCRVHRRLCVQGRCAGARKRLPYSRCVRTGLP